MAVKLPESSKMAVTLPERVWHISQTSDSTNHLHTIITQTQNS